MEYLRIQKKNSDFVLPWNEYMDIIEGLVERYSIVIPFYDEFHELVYSDMVSQMILDRLEKGMLMLKNLSVIWRLTI